MKVLHVVKKYPEAIGGDAVVVSKLQEQQVAAGHRVATITSNCIEIRRQGNVYKCGLRTTPDTLDAITATRIMSLMLLAIQSFAILRREQPDIIHTHSIDMACAVSLAARLYGIPIIHTFHIVTFYDSEQSWLRRKAELLLARLSAAVCFTAPNMHDVKSLIGRDLPAQLLSNGVDVQFWRMPSAKKSKRKRPFTFVSVGRLEEQKGYAVLIEAIALLAKITERPFQVIVVGDGSLSKVLSKLVNESHVTAYISFVGRKTPEETRELVAGADAALCASLYETTPLTLLEAWAMKLPVVSTEVGILSEAEVAANAYLAVPGSAKSLQKAMMDCMQDTKRWRKGRAGYTLASQYSWQTVAQEAERMYRSIA